MAKIVTNFGETILVSLLLFCSGNSLKLNNDGGYEIQVALDETSPVPTIGASRYIENMKLSLGVFSSRMWVVTKGHFYLKSVDVLIPSHWTVDSSSAATSQSYQAADIRLSPNVSYPHAENPNVCGLPGNYIELPEYFFNVTNSGPYGLHWKSLLHTWALYRFGVHPEHGFVGDSKYPYAQRDARSQQWKVTGCSSADVKGRFIDITNPDANCEAATSLSDNCRFVPDSIGQTATSSLMHFHWIESVTEFCDETTHDKYSKNKQNALCDHRSVWEVIRESPDYLAVQSPRSESIPRLEFQTVKHSALPLFYLLMDRGLIQGSFSVALQVPPLIASFLSVDLRSNLASVGAFPGSSAGSVVSDLVEWAEVGQNSGLFVDAIGTLRTDGPLERDFSRALMEVAEKIKRKNHPNGAVVLMVKFGADVKNMGSYLPESEVIHAFNEGNIIFNSIELNFPNHTGNSHLASVARATGGSYTVLDSYGEVETNVVNVLRYVRRILLQEYDYSDLNKNWKLLRKETLNTISTIPIPDDITGGLQAFISTRNPNLSSGNFQVTGYNSSGHSREMQFRVTKTVDWNEAGSKLTYRLDVSKTELNEINQVYIRLNCASGDCSSNILARAEYSKLAHGVEIQVGASVENGYADLSNGRPISVFAKVTKNRVPVQDALVTATLTDTLTSRTTTVRLLDNGEGTPDVQEVDGVYSAYFAPEIDGQYKMVVTVEGNPSRRKRRSVPKHIDESAFIRLLPIDQGDVGCGSESCESEMIDPSFSQTVQMAMPITVVQSMLYTPVPSKIVTLMAFDRPDLGQVTLFWLAPSIPGRQQSVKSYEMRMSPSLETLISDFDNQTLAPIPPNFRPKPPLNMETFSITRPSTTMYYAVRSASYSGRNSTVSNIVEVIVSSTPTEPTDPTRPTDPTETSDPTETTNPTDPSNPTGPTDSSTSPTELTGPTDSSTSPSDSTGPTDSSTNPSDPTGSTNPPTDPNTNPTESSPPENTTSFGTTVHNAFNRLFLTFVTFAVVSFCSVH